MLARRNMVIFMRYLTCLTDQIRCLMSPRQEKALGLEVPHNQNLIDGGCRVRILGPDPLASAPLIDLSIRFCAKP